MEEDEWSNVLNVKGKSPLIKRLGRRLEDQTGKEREQNAPLNSLDAAEKPSERF